MTSHDPYDHDLAPADDAAPVSLGRRRALTLIAGAGLTAVVGGVAALAKGGSAPAEAATARRTTTTLRRAAGATTSTTAEATTTTAAAATTSTTAKRTTSTKASSGTTATTEATTATTQAVQATGSGPVVGAIPQETGGPYPADGTNGPNVLTQSGIVRSDLRSSFGSGSGTADGVVLDIELTMVQAGTGVLLPGTTVYLWHCDRTGNYSQYGSVTGANYLRGVGVAGADGVIRFRSIFPGAYSGRWPHIHFEVFANQAAASTGRNAVRTSQLALPAATCQQVYASSGYESSASNLSRSSLTSDMVFSDGVDLQLAAMSGSVASGYTARLAVGI
jgi:protocatechuate 3,4-dioxygenase beta subunit